MALIFADRVKDTFTTTGTGAVTVSGAAAASFRTFSAVCSTSDTFYYCIEDAANGAWETGLGTYSSTNQITRTTVKGSSNGNAAVSFAAGTKTIFITPIAFMFVGVSQIVPTGPATNSGLTMATGKLLGRTTASSGAIEEISVGAGLVFSGGSLSNPNVPGLNLLATLTASNSATLADTTHLTSAYALYLIVFENIVPASDQTALTMRVSENAGSTWLSTSNYSYSITQAVGGAAGNSAQTAQTAIALTSKTDAAVADGGVCGEMWLTNPAGTASHKRIGASLTQVGNGGALYLLDIMASYNGDTNAINGLQWYFSSGNIASGKIYIYGVKTS